MKQLQLFLLPMTFCMAFIAYLLQAHMLLSSDVAALMDEGQRMWAGGKYVSDFFETNPPMAMYLYFPVLLFVKMTGINIIFSVRLYVVALALVSLNLSIYFLKKIVAPKDYTVFYAWVIMLALVLFLLPMYEFGQREHLLYVLILPYLFAAVLAYEGKTIPVWMGCLVAVMGAFGFALKPFFLTALFLVELSFIVKHKKMLAWVRIESLIVALLMTIYYVSIFLLQPEYIKVLAPLVAHYYLDAHGYTWKTVIARPAMIVCTLTIGLYLLNFRFDQYRHLNRIFFLALVGMFAAVLMQKAGWFSHVLAALSLAMLLFASYVGQFLGRKNKRENVLLIIFLFLLYIPLLQDTYAYNKLYIHYNQNRGVIRELKAFINARGGEHSIYCLSVRGTQDCYPLTLMSNSSFAGRPPFMWWVGGLADAERQPTARLPLAKVAKDKQFLVNSLAEDLNNYRTRWLLVSFLGINKFAAENEQLRLALGNYKFVKSIGYFRVYERK